MALYFNCHSVFSFRFGTLQVEELLQLAKQHELTTVGLTDINNTSACINFVREARNHGIRPIVGIDFRNGVQQQFIGLAQNNQGFQALNAYLSGFLHQKIDIPERAEELAAVSIIYPFAKYRQACFELKENEWLGIRPEELKQLPFSPWEAQTGKMVILHPVTFGNRADFEVHRLLRAIDNNQLLSQQQPEELTLPHERMVPEARLEKVFEKYPGIIDNTHRLMASCDIHFEFKESQKSGAVNQNKRFFTASQEQDYKKLRQLCEEKLAYRYPEAEKQKEARERLEKELEAIYRQGFCAYFLINWDLLNYARKKGYFYVGRGSGANSIVAYCLQITDVDPVQLDLYFERFINPYRENPPDFDIDFSWKDREDITAYLFEKYSGQGQIALLATYSTFKMRSLIRELGKVYGLPKAEIDVLADGRRSQQGPDQLVDRIMALAKRMQGIPSHLSIHAGGILISERPIHYFAATTMPPKKLPFGANRYGACGRCRFVQIRHFESAGLGEDSGYFGDGG